MTARLFGIGIFPWVMIAGTITFFDADWPRRLIADLRQRRHRTPIRLYGLYAGAALGFFIGGLPPRGLLPLAGVDRCLGRRACRLSPCPPGRAPHGRRSPRPGPRRQTSQAQPACRGPRGGRCARCRAPPRAAAPTLVVALLAAWVAFQVALPLRHFFLPGNVHWDGRGPPLRLAYEAPGQELGRHLLRDQPRYRRNLGDRQIATTSAGRSAEKWHPALT